MHIKQISIQGFKSYKDQTEVEEFSPGQNAVVGRNGSGKSNFFAAIRFVLSDAYNNMSREERQNLLHEGAGPSNVNAYVEIVFDNSDNRFPTGRDEVFLRRTIGLKKDEYQLDKKSVPKSEIMSLLESAGFSRSNPYYIVPQGRITSLCNSKEEERLHLLKEVAGTRVYEQRRKESLKIMEETELKRSKIDELLKYIEDRLEELQEEKEELRKFYEIDRVRRSLEYTIYLRENKEIADELEALEENWASEMESTKVRNVRINDRDKIIMDLEAELEEARKYLDALKLERKQLDSEQQENMRSKTMIDLRLKDIESDSKVSQQEIRQLKNDLQSLDKDIKSKSEALSKLTAELEKLRTEEAHMQRQFEEMDAMKQLMFDKRARLSKFKSKSERDKYLNSQIESLKKGVADRKKSLNTLEKEKKENEKILSVKNKDTQEKENDLAGIDNKLRDVLDKLSNEKKERDSVLRKRKELWKKDAQLEGTLLHIKEDMRNHQRALKSTTDAITNMGLESVRKIADRLGLRGVYGPLYQLFQVDEVYATAVDITAGGSLFHVVVENDDIAEQILTVLNREKSGRVTFMPLNRLRNENSDYPEIEGAIPMISKLRFESRFSPAFRQVFGKAMICSDLKIAAAVSKSHGFDAITLDGDRVARKGALTGGFHESRRSRIAVAHLLKIATNKFEASEELLSQVKQEIEKTEQQLVTLQSSMAQLETEKRHLYNDKESSMHYISAIKSSVRLAEKTVRDKDSLVKSISQEISIHESEILKLQEEATQPIQKELSSQELKELDVFVKKLPQLQQNLGELSLRRADVEIRKNTIESELSEKLQKQRSEISERLQKDDGEGAFEIAEEDELANFSVADLKTRLKQITAELKQTQNKLAKVDLGIEDYSAKMVDISQSIDKSRQDHIEDQGEVDSRQKYVERYISKKSLLTQKKEECSQKIKELGALPEDAYEKYVDASNKSLVKELHRAHDKLKKFNHINKKAFEQFNSFTKQRDSLLERKRELDSSAKAITDLIEVLDHRKNEAIENTFKQFSENFAEIFEKLVPAGRGQLLINRRVVEEAQSVTEEEYSSNMDIDSQQSSANIVDSYTGIGIRVSFNSKTDEGLLMNQLSGGQKSLVALALIFAIQKCDPAPFYLFDEIDANLDVAYRESVAQMICELSRNAQFIATTFRPEMLQFADKFYGVTFHDRVSHIQTISRENAMEFVEQEVNAEVA